METPEIKLVLTVEEINTVLGALNELPAKFTMNTIIKIKRQSEKELMASGKKPVKNKRNNG